MTTPGATSAKPFGREFGMAAARLIEGIATLKAKNAVSTRGQSDHTANRKGQSAENIFSEDEEEKRFIDAIGLVKEKAWISSSMPWNTIHGIPWKRCEELGRGSFGAVYLGMREDNKLFAVKSIRIKYPTTRKAAINITCQITEIKMMRVMRSKYIIRCLGCGRSSGDNQVDGENALDVFLEYVARGSLKHVAKRRKNVFEETPYIKQYTYDVLKGLQYMRKRKIIHGDIKMSNLLLSDDCVKLADWGGSKQLSSKNLRTILTGTRRFQSPEVINREEQSYPADIFALGCTVIEMIIGRSPNELVKTTPNFATMGMQLVYHPEIPRKASLECKDFLKLCLRTKPEDRWTAAELLHHPFITNRDKTCTLPYDMPLPKLVNASLLQPPRANLLDLPDEPITDRVYRHLTGLPDSWMPDLMRCRPAPAPEPAIPLKPATTPSEAPAPLPPFSPNLSIKEHTKLSHELVRALGANQPTYMVDIKREPGHEKSDSTEGGEMHRVRFSPKVAVKEFEACLSQSASLMDGLNDDIYAEARRAAAAAETIPEGSVSNNNPGDLFPHLTRSRGRREDPNIAQVADGHRWGLSDVMTFKCSSNAAIDALPPEKKKKR